MSVTKQQVAALYAAVFNRAPDQAGLDFWTTEAESFASMAEGFVGHPVFEKTYGELSNEDFVKAIYENVLQGAGDDAGVQFWVDALDAGQSRADFLADFLDAALNYDGDDADALTRKAALDNQVEAGLYYTETMGEKSNLDPETDVGSLDVENDAAYQAGQTAIADVTADPASVEAAKAAIDKAAAGEEEGEGDETDMLTEALAELADAKEAQVDFLKGLELDVNNDGKYDSADHAEGKATEGNVNTVFSAAATAIAGATGITLANTDYEDLTKQALQDVDMTTAKTAAQGNVTVAAAVAKNGMTALIEAADQALEDYNAAVEVYDAADEALAIEVAAFEAANSTITVATDIVYASAYNPAADNSTKIIISNGKAYTGQDGSTGSGPVALADLVEDATVKRVTELEAANNTKVAAQTTAGNQHEALVDAVGAIYVSEAGGHSLKDIGTAVTALTTPPATIASYSLTDGALEIHKTAADAAAFGVKQVIKVTAGAGTAAGDITLDSVTVALLKDDTPAQVATKIAEAFQSSTKWDVTANGDEVTFAGAVAGNAVLVAASDFADTGTTGTTVTVGANSITAATLTSGAANADALKTALSNLDALEKAIANFEAARDIKVELEALKKDVVDAGKAITDSVEDGGLGVTLREGDQNFTTSDDVYLFDANKTTATNLTNFGAKGEDKIFFGESFTGGLEKITKVADDNGDASALEIFWLQNGTSVDLYVEQKAFAGNGSTDSDLVKITLAGVKGEDLSFEDGFLTIA